MLGSIAKLMLFWGGVRQPTLYKCPLSQALGFDAGHNAAAIAVATGTASLGTLTPKVHAWTARSVAAVCGRCGRAWCTAAIGRVDHQNNTVSSLAGSKLGFGFTVLHWR